MPRFPNNGLLRLLVLSGLIATIPLANVLADENKEAKEMYQLMQAKGYRCLECHDVEIKVVGPAWKEVSAKRKDATWPTALITYKLSEGSAGDGEYRGSEVSTGQYGSAEMPHHQISDEDALKIAKWILGLADSKVQLAAEISAAEISKDQKVKKD